ncbi:MAG: hypothetical protein WHU10_04855 [Fimbriimonadales bacterium]
MKLWFLFLVSAVVMLVVAGCASTEDSGQATTSEVAFEGTQDPKVVGVWVKEDGKSKYTFQADGKYTFEGTVQSPGGSFPVKESGEWAVKDGEMRFRRSDKAVLAYTMELSGDSLKLVTKGSLKNETRLRREK